MITGAYKKLKSYYYYDKTVLFNKMRLATWEHPADEMNRRINDLANFMCSLESQIDNEFLSMLMKQISLIPIPKSFDEQKLSDKNLLQNVLSSNRKLNKVNFYIKAPVELLILDTIWSLMIGKIAMEQGVIKHNVYANKLKKQIFNSNFDLFQGIDFNSNRLFYPYFKQYSSWRDNAFKVIQNHYDSHEDSILISLDIKSYYYSIIFDFKQIPVYLNEDVRLNSIDCLTNIIKTIYISYTAEMQKYRGNISADCKKEQSALPIGLTSSMILANLYLNEFDKAIHTKINPLYYGRYVDDILLVIDRTEDMEFSLTNIIEKVFVKKDILESRDNSYRILVPKSKLVLQKDKIRCIYFDHTEPDAMIKLLCEASNLKPSMSDGFLMPDVDLSGKNFDEFAYSIGQKGGTIKIRSFLFSTNNYGASLFLNDLLRASKNVNIHEKKHHDYIERQLEQILKFYISVQAIEYRTAWINIFNLILANERYDYFIKFYDQVCKAIKLIAADNMDSIVPSKTEYVLEQLKMALFEQLSISASIALAPHALSLVQNNLKTCIDNKALQTSFFDIDLIFSNAKDIRNANMFNNHILAFSLLSYLANIDDNLSLVNINSHSTSNYFVTHQLDRFKLIYSPRFIHLDELYLWQFMTNFHTGGNPFQNKLKELNDKFININKIENSLKTVTESTGLINHYLQDITIRDSSDIEKIKIALASIYIDESADVVPVLSDFNYNLSPNKKGELYKMLNEAKSKEAQIIIFPEFYMPIQWLQEILIFARKNKIAILSGLRYLVNNDQAFNYFTVIQPFSSDKFKYSIPLFREKNYYAPAEKIALAKKKLHCKDPENKSTQLIKWNGLRYSNLMCYELTNIEYRYCLRGLIDLLVVPELNKDTKYFSNMVESTTRDLHTFVIQVNTSKYGDSRITGPYNSLFKDIIKLKGGEDHIVLTGTIDIAELRNNRETYIKKLEEKILAASNGEFGDNKPDEKKPKDPVAGYQKEVRQ